MIKVSFSDNPDYLSLKSDLHDKAGIELIPGSKYRGRGVNRWEIPRTYTACLALINTFGTQASYEAYVELDADVLVWYTEESAAIDTVYEVIENGMSEDVRNAIRSLMPDGFEPREHQIDAAVFLASVRGAALFDVPGMGKTATVGMAMSMYQLYPALVVCPKSLLYNWRRELRRFGIEPTILIGTPAQRRKILATYDPAESPVMVTSYEMVKAHSNIAGYGNIALKRCKACGGKDAAFPETKCEAHKRELNEIPWRTVAVDEAHRIGSAKTAQTRAVWAVSAQAEYRWPMTGTPIESSPMDMWSLLRFMSPTEFSGSSKFRDRFVKTYENFWGGTEIVGLLAETKDEFDRVTGWRWMRSEATGLPPKETELRTCTLSPKELKAYKQMDKQLMAELDDGQVLDAENNMVAWLRLNQFANGTVNVDDNGKVVLSEPSSKMDLMDETLDDLPKDEPKILWFVSVDLLEMAQKRLDAAERSYVSVYGDMSAEAVDDAVQAFQEGKVDHILLTFSKGGEGITLTRSRIAINVQRHPSAIKMDQAEKRNERIGSEIHDSLLEINLVAEGTVEEEYDEKLQAKHDKRDEVLVR